MTDTVKSTHAFPNLSVLKSAAGQTGRTAPPKSQLVKKLLRRGKGATIAELQEATAWQPHSVRALLSGLRKKGEVLGKKQRKSGETAYRVSVGKAATVPADA